MSWNGPPMATVRGRSLASKMTPIEAVAPARKAAIQSTMRKEPLVISRSPAPHLACGKGISEAGGDPGQDRLVEDRRSVVRPKRQRAGEHDSRRCRRDRQRKRKSRLRRGHRLRHNTTLDLHANHIGRNGAKDN